MPNSDIIMDLVYVVHFIHSAGKETCVGNNFNYRSPTKPHQTDNDRDSTYPACLQIFMVSLDCHVENRILL